ncbi:hypothetical protein GCM10025868_37920 [Angustibacter aerolatus]|uniref:Uncharacterized protein n=1 Tax=Angustibacter aerolatus TaxID=1162965 RepID=A0ABQ6JJY3_9ACTN|nr:hypothetical protein GCM10025868_37920 [Angustibacter aerolatus]
MLVVDVDPQAAQRTQQRADRPAAHALVAVEEHRAVGEGRGRRQEAHHGARQPGVDRDVTGERAGDDQPLPRPRRSGSP